MRIPTALVTLLVLTAPFAACTKPPAEESSTGSQGASSESSRVSEAARTDELEQKAAEYNDRFAEIQASDMSAEEKAQAVNDLMQEQQRTLQEAEDGGGSGGDGY
ncbi:MAG: hypothetical protein AB7G12_01170 [Thermoanaerobaculia bacterium]